MKLLNRLFSFLTVQDPRQTRVNKVLFGVIVCWIGFGGIINTVNMVIYYWPEWAEGATTQQSLFFQLEWLPKIPDVPAPLFALMFVTASVIIQALWKRSREDRKEMKELLQAFLPLLQEMKTHVSSSSAPLQEMRTQLAVLVSRWVKE